MKRAFPALAMAAAMLILLTHRGIAQEELFERLTIHGYLNQAYAWSTQTPILGITKTPRFDYRVLGLQTRYALTEDDEFVVQVRHRQFGNNLLTDLEDDIKLSWAYYAHRFGPIQLKAGRTPVSVGLYNETRFVGTLLPFFRAPVNVYPEGVETIDGVTLTYTSPTVNGWSLQTSVDGGNSAIDDVLQTPTGPVPTRLNIHMVYGGQIRLMTPLQGLGFGFDLHRFDVKNTDGKGIRNRLATFSLDANSRWASIRAEYSAFDLGIIDLDWPAAYVQAGFHFTPAISLNAQYDYSIQKPKITGPEVPMHDRAIGARYAFNPNLVMKYEWHRATGYLMDVYLPPNQPEGRTSYSILSLAVSF